MGDTLIHGNELIRLHERFMTIHYGDTSEDIGETFRAWGIDPNGVYEWANLANKAAMIGLFAGVPLSQLARTSYLMGFEFGLYLANELETRRRAEEENR